MTIAPLTKINYILVQKNLVLETNVDPNFPLVAWFEKNELTTNGGRVKVEIVSCNLENSVPVYDPVTNKIEKAL